MPKKRFNAEQIVTLLRQIEVSMRRETRRQWPAGMRGYRCSARFLCLGRNHQIQSNRLPPFQNPPMFALGHKRTNHRRPKPTVVRCCPKADIERHIQGSIWLAVYESTPSIMAAS